MIKKKMKYITFSLDYKRPPNEMPDASKCQICFFASGLNSKDICLLSGIILNIWEDRNARFSDL